MSIIPVSRVITLPQRRVRGSGQNVTISGGADFPNEPGGFSVVMEHDFTNDVSTVGWTASGLAGVWRDENGGDYVNDATAPLSPQRCLRTTFANGTVAGGAPCRISGWDTGEFGTEMERIYYSSRFMIEGSDYQNQAVGTKMGFWGFNNSSSAANQGFFIIPGTGVMHTDANFNIEFWQQGNVSPDTNWGQNVDTSRVFTCGVWHHWETLFIVNTIGSANGTLKMWMDGTLIHNHTNVTYRDGGNPKGFFGYSWNPTWGGIGGTKDRDDFMRQDHVRISGIAL